MALSTVFYTSNTDEWPTPQEFFQILDNEFHFTLDVCATSENAKCPRFFTKEQNGLIQNWSNDVVFCNPPYGKTISQWCEKAYRSANEGATVVMLIPARTDTRWFHDWMYGKAELRFVKGRLKFGNSKHCAPFPSLVAIYKPGHTSSE